MGAVTRVKIVCHDASPRWVSWGYVITWPDGSTEMRMGCRDRDHAEYLARQSLGVRCETDGVPGGVK